MIPDAARGLLARLRHGSSGQDLIEHALLAAMIALAVVFGLNTLSAAIQSRYTTIAGDVQSGDVGQSGPGSAAGSGAGGGGGGASIPAAAAAPAGGSGSGGSNSGNNGNHAGGGNNGNGRGNGS